MSPCGRTIKSRSLEGLSLVILFVFCMESASMMMMKIKRVNSLFHLLCSVFFFFFPVSLCRFCKFHFLKSLSV